MWLIRVWVAYLLIGLVAVIVVAFGVGFVDPQFLPKFSSGTRIFLGAVAEVEVVCCAAFKASSETQWVFANVIGLVETVWV